MQLFSSYSIKFVWSLTKQYFQEIIHSSVVIFVLKVLGFLSPIFTMILIDDVLPHSQTNTLAVIMLATIGLYVIETILNTAVDWMMFSSFTRLSTDISTNIFDALFRLPMDFFSSNRTGDIISKILSSETLRSYLSEKPMKLAMDVFFGFSFLFFLIYLSPALTFVAVITVPMDFYTSYLWTKRRQYLADRSVILANEHNGTLVESVSGTETIYQMDASSFFSKVWIDEIIEILLNAIALKKNRYSIFHYSRFYRKIFQCVHVVVRNVSDNQRGTEAWAIHCLHQLRRSIDRTDHQSLRTVERFPNHCNCCR